MALADIIKKIQDDTEAQVKALRDDFETEKQARLDDFEDYKKQFLTRAEHKAQESARLHRERLISRAQADANLELLSKKQELLHRVYDTAREKIDSMNDDKKIDLFTGIFADIGIKEGKILVPKGSALDSEKFVKSIENKVDNAKVTKEPVDDFDMGFVLVAGKIRYDNTLASLMEQAKELLQDKLVDILFGKQE